MKNSLSVFSFLFLAVLSASYGQTEQEFKTTPTSVIGYIEYLPPDYDANSFEYPLVVFLHGLGQRGPNSTDPEVLKTGYHHLVTYGPPKQVKTGTQFPFILVSPALKSNYGDWPSWYVMEVIEHVRTYMRIDPKRIYLTGPSLGGGGTWVTAQDYPDYFGAIAPVMGSRNSLAKACDIAKSDLPVWAFHGDRDNVVPLSRSVNMVNAINACNPGIKARMTIYEGVGHNAHVYAYDLGEVYQKPNLYKWLLSWENDLGNKIPEAEAGPDLTTRAGNTIVLRGKGSDADGTIANYSWIMLKGAGATLSGRTSPDVSVSGLQKGTYVFRLTVRDNDGAIASDDVTVVVDGTGNIFPVANAGADKTITLPVNSVVISGSGSDSDGTITSYAWTKVSGGTAALSGAGTAKLTASNLQAGSYTFRLTVKDNAGASSSDDVNVFVNRAPTVSAGADVALTLPQNSATIKGIATDADGSLKSYAWTKISGPALQMSGTTSTDLAISNLIEGKYVLRLTVTDNRNASASDEVTVTVAPAATANKTPAANAGADKTITLPVNSVVISGSGSDSDGTITSYTWTKVSGGTAALSGAGTAKLTASNLQAGSYTFRLTVKDNAGASSSDDVNVFVNRAPTVSAGADVALTLPQNSATIKGVATDADGSIKSYAWTKISGPALQMSGTTSTDLAISNLIEGKYVLRLTVTDNRNASAYDEVTVTVAPAATANKTPVANAGADKTITIPVNSVVISGSGSDSDGTITSYTWTKVSGGTAALSGAGTAKLTASNLQAGSYTFRLTVKDNAGASSSDDVNVFVNRAPTVSAGADVALTLPQNSATIKGVATDADGSIKSFAWTKISGPALQMSGTTSTDLAISNLVEGKYVLRLTVTDNRNASAYDEVTVTVAPAATANKTPVANAGADKTITLPQNSITLSGSGNDPDGTITSYQWTKVSGGAATLSGAGTASLTVSGLTAGVYKFRFAVTDNRGSKASDDVVITVNQPPVANAGADRVISLPANSIRITGTGTDADGQVTAFKWSKISGGKATLAGAGSATLDATDLEAGDYIFRLQVIDNLNGVHTDDVKVRVNIPPVAHAGADRKIALPGGRLDIKGTGSDADGSITAYRWKKVSGGSVTLSGTNTANVSLSGFSSGTFVLELIVTDNDGATHADKVTISVGANQLPVANAGADRVISLPSNSLVLQGSGSDADGTIVEYLWEKVSGGTAAFSNQRAPHVTLTGLVSGDYVFSLTVVDNAGGKHTDAVNVRVNTPPLANAGDDKIVHLPQNEIVLSGTASDIDGEIAFVSWTKVSGGTVSLGGKNTSTLTADKLNAGVYDFRFTVIDNDGASHSDIVRVIVNRPPVVDAGPDASIRLPQNSVQLRGSANDGDGVISSWFWTKVSGAPVDWKGRYSANLDVYNLQTGTYVFRLQATDDRGAKSVDDVIVEVLGFNEPPVADAGPDQFLVLPLDSLTIEGTGSDREDSALSFNWTQSFGMPVTLKSSSEPRLHVSGLSVGVYTFRLTVTDADGASHSDETVVTVDPAIQPEEVITDPMHIAGCAECEYVIWGQNLQRLHDGPWRDDTFERVFATTGIYYFNVRRGGETIRRGKIFRFDR